jgi:hypothetical protein
VTLDGQPSIRWYPRASGDEGNRRKIEVLVSVEQGLCISIRAAMDKVDEDDET